MTPAVAQFALAIRFTEDKVRARLPRFCRPARLTDAEVREIAEGFAYGVRLVNDEHDQALRRSIEGAR